jgi:hypothetical protein
MCGRGNIYRLGGLLLATVLGVQGEFDALRRMAETPGLPSQFPAMAPTTR